MIGGVRCTVARPLHRGRGWSTEPARTPDPEAGPGGQGLPARARDKKPSYASYGVHVCKVTRKYIRVVIQG